MKRIMMDKNIRGRIFYGVVPLRTFFCMATEGRGVKRRCKRAAFTLVELMTVIVIFGVMLGVLSTVLFTNWSAYLDRMVHGDLWGQADEIFERMTYDGRSAGGLRVVSSPGSKSATFLDVNGQPVVTYSVTPDGHVMALKGQAQTVLSTQGNFEMSDFKDNGRALSVQLGLTGEVWGRKISIAPVTEIFVRN